MSIFTPSREHSCDTMMQQEPVRPTQLAAAGAGRRAVTRVKHFLRMAAAAELWTLARRNTERAQASRASHDLASAPCSASTPRPSGSQAHVQLPDGECMRHLINLYRQRQGQGAAAEERRG